MLQLETMAKHLQPEGFAINRRHGQRVEAGVGDRSKICLDCRRGEEGILPGFID